jgi:hypothetical protein
LNYLKKVEIATNAREIATRATIVVFLLGSILRMTKLQEASIDNTAFLDTLIEYLEQLYYMHPGQITCIKFQLRLIEG